jgi:hypothetical protein
MMVTLWRPKLLNLLLSFVKSAAIPVMGGYSKREALWRRRRRVC